MFKKLVMLVFLGILLSFNVVNAQEAKDELPPLVIETNDVEYAGVMLDLAQKPTITARQETAIHKEPSSNSPIVGTMQQKDTVLIIGAKAYIYPRMGKTRVIKDITLTDYMGNEKILKPGDIMYMIYHESPGGYIVWYKGTFFKVDWEQIKMPAPYYFNPYFTDGSPRDDICAEYEGYTNKQDVEADFETYIEYPNDDQRAPMNTWAVVRGNEFRCNADIWLYVELPDKVTKGWVQLINAHLGSKTYKQIWWSQLRLNQYRIEHNSFYFLFGY